MQTNLLWKGIEYYSLEKCLVNTSNKGNTINSAVIGYYQNNIYSAEYLLETDANWQTRLLEIKYSLNNKENKITLQKDAGYNWLLNNNRTDLFEHCIDVDIAITPFTNTLPVNRMRLSLQEEKKIKVIYINIFGGEIKALEQSYQRVADKNIYTKIFLMILKQR